MFRWCAYCQRLMGEIEPLGKYLLSHGICESCEREIDADPEGNPTPPHKIAQQFYHLLSRAGRNWDLEGSSVFVKRAMQAGLRRSDVLLGLLQPALNETGARCEKGVLTAVEERSFAAWCRKVFALFPGRPPPPRKKTRMLLVKCGGGVHSVGARFLQMHLQDLGFACEMAQPGVLNGAPAKLLKKPRPDVVGIWVGALKEAPAAAEFARRLEGKGNGTRVVLGGPAFRRLRAVHLRGVRVLRTIDDFVWFLGAVEHELRAGAGFMPGSGRGSPSRRRRSRAGSSAGSLPDTPTAAFPVPGMPRPRAAALISASESS